MTYFVEIQGPLGSRWQHVSSLMPTLATDGAYELSIVSDLVGQYSAMLWGDAWHSDEIVLVEDAQVGTTIKFRMWPPTPGRVAPATQQQLTHLFVLGVDLVVGVSKGAVVSAFLKVRDATNKPAIYAAEDSGVKAAVAALVGADLSTVEAAVNNGSPLMTAWLAALSDNTPEVPGVDPAVAALTMHGWAT